MAEVRVGEWSGVENRKHRRVPLHVPIECRAGARQIAGEAENISISGLLVRCASSFEQDSDVSAEFTLPGAARGIHARARVAHVVPGIFMGLELTDVSASDRAQIERFIAAAAVGANP